METISESSFGQNVKIDQRVQSQQFSILNLKNPKIIEVWEYNMKTEIENFLGAIKKFKLIAIDTEFPGIAYQSKYSDDLVLLQLRMITNQSNKMQINQKQFNLGSVFQIPKEKLKKMVQYETYHPDSIKILKKSGLDFEKLKEQGCDPYLFRELIIGSPLIFNDEIHWICFHGSFDFAYFLRILMQKDLHEQEDDFLNSINIYFPKFLDLKLVVADIQELESGGLRKLAKSLEINEIIGQHQAGRDSLVTLMCFVKLKQKKLLDSYIIDNCQNTLYGIGCGLDHQKAWNIKIQAIQQMMGQDLPHIFMNTQFPGNQYQINQFTNNQYNQYFNPQFLNYQMPNNQHLNNQNMNNYQNINQQNQFQNINSMLQKQYNQYYNMQQVKNKNEQNPLQQNPKKRKKK